VIIKYLNHSQLEGAVAVACSDLLGIVAICIMALMLAGWLLWAGDSMKRLMPAVVTIWVLAVVLNAVNVYQKWKIHNSDKQRLQQKEPPQGQTNLQSAPIESSTSAPSDPSRQATGWQQWTTQPAASLGASHATIRHGFRPQVASAAHQVRSDLPYVTMPNVSSSPTAGGGSGGAQNKHEKSN
jgi:hypothetical protein